MSAFTVFIRMLPLGVNAFRRRSTRARMATVKAERERAYVVTLAERNRLGLVPITGSCRITFERRTSRPLLDSLMVGASLKHYQDGVCKALLPLGDGPGTPYVWAEPRQRKVARRADEGVLVRVEIEGRAS